MKFITLSVLFIGLSLASCREGKNEHTHKPPGSTSRKNELNLVNNNVDVLNKVSINFSAGYKRNIQPVCRGINGCLHICDHFRQVQCKQLSADKVVTFWLNKINTYTSWEQAQRDLYLIATEPDISSFLKNMDKENQVAQALFNLNTSASCSTGEQDIGFSYSPSAALYLTKGTDSSSTDPAQQEAQDTSQQEAQDTSEMKKIIDASATSFSLQVFIGFIKKCFGHNTRTFSEMAIQIENKDAFNIGHEVISNACSENNECIRLAYCDINSELVWNELPKDIKTPGCEYSNFVEVLP